MAWLSTTLLPGCLSAIIQAGPGFEVVFNYIFAYRDDRRHVLSRADVVGQSYGSQLSRCPQSSLDFQSSCWALHFREGISVAVQIPQLIYIV